MSAPKPQPAVKRSDPSLREKTSKDSFRPFGLPRWAGLLLYAVFWVVLVIPFVRRHRRKPSWNRVRLAGGLAAALLLGLAWGLPNAWLAAPAVALAVAAAVLGPAPDPERERKLQTRYKADYFLNGGCFAGGPLPGEPDLAKGAALYLLMRRKELLVVPVEGPGEAVSIIPVECISEVRVNGEPYRPVFIPEAKDPPVRENAVDRSQTTALELLMAGGEAIRFEYKGAFCKPLAEAAAHAIHSVLSANRVPSHSPEVFHIVGR